MSLSALVCAFLSYTYLGAELPSHCVCMSESFADNIKLLFKVALPIYILTNITISIISLFILAILVNKLGSSCGFKLCCPDNEVEHICIYLFAIF